jgi:hypothetical protein
MTTPPNDGAGRANQAHYLSLVLVGNTETGLFLLIFG